MNGSRPGGGGLGVADGIEVDPPGQAHHTRPAFGSPASRARMAVARAKPPPHESPRKTRAVGRMALVEEAPVGRRAVV